MRRSRLTAAAALLALAAAATGCGAKAQQTTRATDRPQPQPQPVKQAAAATKAAGSARVAFRGSLTASGRSLPLSGRGAVDVKRGVAQLRMGTELPGIGRLDADQLIAGRAVYLRAGGLLSFAAGGKDWLKIDLDRAARAKGADPGVLKSLSGAGNLGEYLTWLAVAGNPVKVGDERIGTTPTTHYRARVDVRRLAASADPGLRRSVDRLALRPMPVDVWIDAQGLVRRERVVATAEGGPVPATLDLTVDLSGYGTPVTAAAPAAADVFDATDLAGSALKLLR